MPLADAMCAALTGENPNMVVPWYLMAAFAYYVQDDPILSDGAFDALAKRAAVMWDFVEHPHKGLILPDDLAAGTLLLAIEDYPRLVVGALEQVRKEHGGRER